jgi:hypothetical protein
LFSPTDWLAKASLRVPPDSWVIWLPFSNNCSA